MRWIYRHDVERVDQMTNLSKELRERLAASAAHRALADRGGGASPPTAPASSSFACTTGRRSRR